MTNRGCDKTVLEICDEALERQASERDRFLRQVCGKDDDLRREVEALMQAIDDSGEFMLPTIDPER